MFTKPYFLRKLLVSILSTVFLWLLTVIILFIPSATESFKFFFYFVFPVYLIGGFPFSILVDFLWSKANYFRMNRYFKFLLNLLFYAIGGCLVSFVYLVLLTSGYSVFVGINYRFYLFGILAAILYYLVDALIIWLWQRVVTNSKGRAV